MNVESSCALSFSRAADTYEAAAHIQRRIASHLGACLPDDLLPERILDIGCGTGMLTACLRSRFPGASIDGVDISAGMIEAARSRFCSDPHISLHLADARVFDIGRLYDLITSSSALQWMGPLAPLFSKLRGMLSPDGVFGFSLMVDGTLNELHECRSRAASHKPFRLVFPTVDSVAADLRNNGFTVVSCKRMDFVCEFESMTELLKNLHELGVNANPASGQLLSRSELQRLEAEYSRSFMTPEGLLPATFAAGVVEARC